MNNMTSWNMLALTSNVDACTPAVVSMGSSQPPNITTVTVSKLINHTELLFEREGIRAHGWTYLWSYPVYVSSPARRSS